MNDDPRHLVALEQCGLELQAPHLRTTTKRRIETSDVDAATLPDDSLRFVGWAPDAIEARFPGLDPSATYELEATFLCERRRPARPGDDVARPGAPVADRARAGHRDDRPGRPAARDVRGRDAGRGRRAGDGARRRAVGAAAVLVPPAGARDHRRRRLARRAHRHGRGAGLVGHGRRAGAGDGRRRHDRRGDRRQRPVPRPAPRGPAARTTRARHDRDRRWAGDRRGRRGHAPRLPRPAGAAAAVRAPGSRRGLELSRRAVRRPRGPRRWIDDDAGPRPRDLRRPGARGRRRDLPAHGRAARDVGRPRGLPPLRRRIRPCRGGRQRHARGRARQRSDVVRRRPDPVPPTRRQRPRDHADRVHAVRRARRHELVRPHVAARNLAGRPPVLRAAAPPRPARPRRRTGTPSREPGRWRSAWTRSTSASRPDVSSSRRRSGTPSARSPGAAPRAGRSTGRGAPGSRLETGPLEVRPWSAEEPVLYDLEIVVAGDAGEPQAYRRRIGFRRVEAQRQPAPRQRRPDPRPRRQSPRLADPQGPRAVRGRHARGCRQPAARERHRDPDLALPAEPASARHLRRGRDVRRRAAADLLLGRVRRPPLDADQRGRPAGPVSCSR